MTVTMDGYVRVSRVMGREGDAYISPTVQREAIQRWADYKGVTIAQWHVDEDRTGGNHQRPGLEAAVERAIGGDTEGIVSWKIDRFSRHTEHGLRDLRRLQEKGARLAFVAEDIDTNGPMGKFVYTVMLAMAEYFLDNIKAGWIGAKTKAHGRGAKIGPTPFGYRRGDDGLLTIHEDEADAIREAFKITASRGIAEAVTYLDGLDLAREHGKRAGKARSWTTTSVRRMLAQPIYYGEMEYKGLKPKQFPELVIVDRKKWLAAQTEVGQGRKPARHYPLSGIASCGQCGGALVGGAAGGGQRTYRCRASLKSWKGERCDSPTNVTATLLEEHVRAYLLDLLGDGEWVQSETADDLDTALTALADRETELNTFLDDTRGAAVLRRLDRYDSTLDAHALAVEEARDLVQELAKRAATDTTVSPGDLLAGADPEGLATAARSSLARLTVARGRGPLVDRVTLTPHPMPAMAAA